MWYVIRAYEDPSKLQQRLALRPLHLERLQALKTQNKLLVAGPLPAIDSETPGEAGFQGSIIIVNFDSQELVQQWIEQDPFVINNIYHKVEILPFIKGISALD